MEKIPICKTHGKPIQTICVTCHNLLCFKCHAAHIDKSCKGSIDIPSYVAKVILPKYKLHLDNLKDLDSLAKTSMKGFSTLGHTMKKGLIQLKEKLENLLDLINESIQTISKRLQSQHEDDARKALEKEYRNLTEAIASENMSYLIKKLSENENTPELAFKDNKEILIESINVLIVDIANLDSIGKLSKALRELNEINGTKDGSFKRFEKAAFKSSISIKQVDLDFFKSPFDISEKSQRKKSDSKLLRQAESIKEGYLLKQGEKDFSKRKEKLFETEKIVKRESFKLIDKITNKVVYGICYPQCNYTMLCKYDITARKLVPTVTVPKWSTITLIGSKVLISGGCEPVVNTVSEFSETTQIIIKKEPMRYSKYSHRIELIGTARLITVGGYDGMAEIAHCEEYSVSENRWKSIPSLNKPKSDAATSLMYNTMLYAIDGDEVEAMIEVLNVNEMKTWTIIKLLQCEQKFPYSSVAFPISDREILILHGLDSGEVGLFDVKERSIIKCKKIDKYDDFYSNSVGIVDGKAYVIGGGGHIHIYNMGKRKFEDLDYTEVYE